MLIVAAIDMSLPDCASTWTHHSLWLDSSSYS